MCSRPQGVNARMNRDNLSTGPTRILLFLGLALVVGLALPSGEALASKKLSHREELRLDRELVSVMQIRDRGEMIGALDAALELIDERSDFVPAHRLYQEIAVLARRSAALVEAEYRHFYESQPEEPLANLLHAAATLAAVTAAPEMLDREVLRDVERKIALAEGSPALRAQARLLRADIARWGGDADRYEEQLRAALSAAGRSPSVRSDLSIFLATKGQWDEATEFCLGLVADAPWRLISCAPLVPGKAGAEGPSQRDQDRLVAAVEKVEKRFGEDAVVLQGLERFYSAVGERRGAKRVAARLLELDSSWKGPVARNPYVTPLDGGEFSRESVSFIESLQELRELGKKDPKARVKRFSELGSKLPKDRRVEAYYYRELAFALRHPSIDDRAASLVAIRKAWEALPEQASAMNELAYMSAVEGENLEESLKLADAALATVLGAEFTPQEIPFGKSFADFEIALGETVGAYYDTRGWVLYKLGRFEEARIDLELASLLTRDGTVQGHLGRVRFALGNKRGAFHHLIRALALGTEEPEEVRAMAEGIYGELHAIPGGLDLLVTGLQEELLRQGMSALSK